MDFTMPHSLSEEMIGFKKFLKDRVVSKLPDWYRRREISAEFFRQLGAGGWFGFELKEGHLLRGSVLKEALIAEELAKVSPGV
ncbi:MAG: acyl-CoA dehydrogenase family protein, partial [Desulfobacterales bacterium]